jgi:hypothetical protein
VFEKTHRIRLPEDYRMFITELGNGGAGPYYGVFPFGEHDYGHDYCTWELGGLVGDLSAAFPHETAWNASDSLWLSWKDATENMSLDEEDRWMAARDEALEEHYWNPKVMAGAIPICNVGCARRQWLVVNGGQKGLVWGDDRADEYGIYPLLDERGEALTFSEWYMDWMSDPEAFTKRNSRGQQALIDRLTRSQRRRLRQRSPLARG